VTAAPSCGARGDELNREGLPIEAHVQIDDRSGVVLAQLKRGRDGLSALEKEHYRWHEREAIERQKVLGV
jgi:hypothetical protein